MISVFQKLQCATKQATQKADIVKRRDKSSRFLQKSFYLPPFSPAPNWMGPVTNPGSGRPAKFSSTFKKKKEPTVEVENWSFSWMALASVALCMPHVKVRDLLNLSDWPINRLNDTKTGSLIWMERNHWQIHVKITEIKKKVLLCFSPPPTLNLHSAACSHSEGKN